MDRVYVVCQTSTLTRCESVADLHPNSGIRRYKSDADLRLDTVMTPALPSAITLARTFAMYAVLTSANTLALTSAITMAPAYATTLPLPSAMNPTLTSDMTLVHTSATTLVLISAKTLVQASTLKLL